MRKAKMLGQDTIYSWIRDLPVIDWHNHLDWAMLAEDKPLGSLYEVWVKADPYKHRAMRICGEPERLITGDAPEAEKWAAWTRTLPKLVGNPLFAWAVQELKFLSDRLKIERDDLSVGHLRNVSLAEWTPLKLLKAFTVEYASPCTGVGELGALGAVGAAGTCGCRIVPSLRLAVDEGVSSEAWERFAAAGCRIVDISVDDIDAVESRVFKSIGKAAVTRGMTMLLHLGALRETSDRLRSAAGPAGGFAGMRAPVDPAKVARLLNELERDGALPRTILLSLNPEAHAQLAVLAGSFNEAGVPGKVQLGPAWWWCDHKEGIVDVLEKNAAYGVLSTFVGMTTDSRSILSFVRHDYFRRILAQWIADKIAAGDFLDDESLIRPLVENVCYRNARGMVGSGSSAP